MAARAAICPSGKVTAVFSDDAELQGAYDWLENEHFAAADVAHAHHLATARQCIGLGIVFVPTDGSKLTITDKTKTKGTGPIGTRTAKARGDKVHSAIAVSDEGTPMGLCGQQWWIRPEHRRAKHRDSCKVEEKESRFWLEVREQARAVFGQHAPDVVLWFQHDREADAWPVVYEMVQRLEQGEHTEYTTVRSSWDRRLVAEADEPEDAPTRYLRQTLAQSPIRGQYTIMVPAGPKRIARRALMAVRACRVTLDLRDKKTSQHHEAPVWAVWSQEQGTTPNGEKPLLWLLLTTYPVESFEDACQVVYGYTQRWRIEEFHRAWQTGDCDAQEMQLATPERRHKWATVLAAVAMRSVRLTYLAREHPEAPANQEFTAEEIEAMRDLLPRRPLSPTDALTMKEAVERVAKIGGYTGRSSGGPPGTITIARGLKRIEAYAVGLRGHQVRLAAESRDLPADPTRGPAR
jgi:hypothetical protein